MQTTMMGFRFLGWEFREILPSVPQFCHQNETQMEDEMEARECAGMLNRFGV